MLVTLSFANGSASMAAFPISDGEIAQTPLVTERLPDVWEGNECDPPTAEPFYLAVGNFDNNEDQVSNDIAFSDGLLNVYFVDRWSMADEWDRECSENDQDTMVWG